MGILIDALHAVKLFRRAVPPQQPEKMNVQRRNTEAWIMGNPEVTPE
jgi:hypothetical protein